jgi:hypothetical protein
MAKRKESPIEPGVVVTGRRAAGLFARGIARVVNNFVAVIIAQRQHQANLTLLRARSNRELAKERARVQRRLAERSVVPGAVHMTDMEQHSAAISGTNAASPARKRRGLVLEGGGAKGAWQFGVLEAFAESGIEFDVVSGTSVGALNGAIWCTGKIDIGHEMWWDMTLARVFHEQDREIIRPVLTKQDQIFRLYFLLLRRSKNRWG